MSGSQSSLSKRMYPPDSETLSSSSGKPMMNKPNNFQMPPFALHTYGSESSLVNGHPSSQGSNSNSSSRHHSPTPYINHPDAHVGNISGPCLNPDRNKPVGSFQGNNFQDQSLFLYNSNRGGLTKPEIDKPSYQLAGIPNIQSSPNLEAFNFNNRQIVPDSSQNNNIVTSIPNPAFCNNLSSSDTNLANGGFPSRRHINNKEACIGNDLANISLTDGPSLMQSASLSSLDKAAPPQNVSSPSLQLNTSKLFPNRELSSGNIVQKSSPRSSPLPTAPARSCSPSVVAQLPFSDSQRLTSSSLLSNHSINHAMLPAKVSSESVMLKNGVDTFQKFPLTSLSNTSSSFVTSIGNPRPSTFVNSISLGPTLEHPSPLVLRPPPSPLLGHSAASIRRPPPSLINSSTVPLTGPTIPLHTKNNPSLMQNIGSSSLVSSIPSNTYSIPTQTTVYASSPHMLTAQPKPVISPSQSSMFRPSSTSPIFPQVTMTGQSPFLMKGPPPVSIIGSPRTPNIGQPQTSMMVPPQTSMMVPPPTSIMVPPPTSMMVPPPTSMMGPSPTSMMSPPPISMMGPPPSSMIGPPSTSMMGPPSTSMMVTSPTSMMGPPPTLMMGPPPMLMMGPPPTSIGLPTTSTIGSYQATKINPTPTSMKVHSPASMMGHPPTSMVGTSSTPMIGPPTTSTIGPPPLTMLGPPSKSATMGLSSKSPVGLPTSSTMVQTSDSNTFQFSPISQPPSSYSTSGMSSHSISNVKFPPSSINRPSSNSVLSPPPTTMVGPPLSLPGASGLNLTKNLNSHSTGILSGNTLQSPVGSSNRYPGHPPPQSSQVNQLSQQLGGLSVTREGWNKAWGTHVVDLLQQKTVIPPQGIVPPKPILLQDYLPNCSPDIFRCTISKVPETQSILQKSRLPFGIVIHPFKDLEHLAVVSCNTIVRCRSCRTYINPFVIFKGERRWECNLCFRVNDLPDEFQFDPLTRTYGDPSRRPEVREATIEFIAPQEYMLRPPQPATYIWVLDVSRQAVETGYLKVVCDTLLDCLDKIPGDRRALIGFITFSTTVQFYLMGEGQKDVQMLDVGEIDDIFIPSPDDLLVHLDESRNLIEELLKSLPETHNNNVFTQTAFGAALTAAHKLLAPIGGRITAMAVTLPTIGPGALKPREDPNQRSAKNISNLGPATDFYKKLALDCSGQQIAVDLFTFNSQYIDLATLSGVSRFSGGCMHHFPGFNVSKNPASVEPFKSCLTRYITRKIGFEAVMRIRTTRGLDITNFHGNFFVRSTDLLSLPNINPDSGFGMQLSIEEPLHNIRQACFQAALLYTSSKGERRIRVHTLCLPVCPNIHEVIAAGDQQVIVDLLAKMAVDRCLSSQMSDAREAIVNTCSDIISAYKASLSSSTAGLPMPASLQALPLYLLGLLKSMSLRHGISTKLDDRVFAMFEMKTMPLKYLIQSIYPDLFAISYLSETGALNIDDLVIPQPDHLQLSGEYIDRDGAYLMDVGSFIYIYVRSGISSEWVNDVLGVPSFAAIPQPLYEDPFPVLDNPTSELVRNFLFYLQRNKSYYVPVYVIREDNSSRNLFLQYLIDDRSEGTHSYVEFLQFIKSLVK